MKTDPPEVAKWPARDGAGRVATDVAPMLDQLVNGRHDLSLAEYHSLVAWGSSDLKAMRLGPPAMVPWRREHPSEETDATRLGTAAHCRILEPGLFGRIYAHKPEGMTFSTKEGKEWRAAVEPGTRILSHSEWVAVDQIAAAFDGKPLARKSLDRAVGIEASFVAACPTTGERVKSRPDWFDGEAIVDLKVSRHAVERSVAFQAYVQGWMHQVSYYRDVVRWAGGPELAKGRLVVVAPKPPQHLGVYCVEVKGAALDWLSLENEKTLGRLKECRVSGSWPGTPEEWIKVEPPASALAEIAFAADFEEV